MIVHLLAWRTSMLRGSGKRTVLTAFEAVRFAFQIIVLDVCYDLVLGLESLMDSIQSPFTDSYANLRSPCEVPPSLYLYVLKHS